MLTCVALSGLMNTVIANIWVITLPRGNDHVLVDCFLNLFPIPNSAFRPAQVDLAKVEA